MDAERGVCWRSDDIHLLATENVVENLSGHRPQAGFEPSYMLSIVYVAKGFGKVVLLGIGCTAHINP